MSGECEKCNEHTLDCQCKAILHPLSFMDLIREAQQMLLDRSKQEADLIYSVACLNDEERAAISMAYRISFQDEK